MPIKLKKPTDLRARRGKVKIFDDFINKNPKDMLAIFAHFLVVRAEYLFVFNAVEYQGYCHLFEPLFPGSEMPEYQFELTKDERGRITDIKAAKRSW